MVFDALCQTDSGLSLNDAMIIGPIIQEDLTSILMRFRTFKYVLVADIIKMYRQIQLHSTQTRLHRIFWRNDPDSTLEVHELTTVTYDTSAASFLATRCLKYHAKYYAEISPVCVARNFYVDDMLTGADSIADAIEIRDQTIRLLRESSFELSKWRSNCPELLDGVGDQGERLVAFDKDNDVRILGILWNRDSDTFRFSNPTSGPVTKRSILSILSEVSRLFDPLGLLGPIIITAKVILQDLCQSGVDWDESVPQDIHTEWLQLKLQLSDTNQLQIPRCVKLHIDEQAVELHGFCDASQRAYGACVYFRSKIGEHNYKSALYCSKSRIAPFKAVSLPHLELSAALLLAQLIDKIKSSLTLENTRTILWSDSTIALSWISPPSRK